MRLMLNGTLYVFERGNCDVGVLYDYLEGDLDLAFGFLSILLAALKILLTFTKIKN